MQQLRDGESLRPTEGTSRPSGYAYPGDDFSANQGWDVAGSKSCQKLDWFGVATTKTIGLTRALFASSALACQGT